MFITIKFLFIHMKTLSIPLYKVGEAVKQVFFSFIIVIFLVFLSACTFFSDNQSTLLNSPSPDGNDNASEITILNIGPQKQFEADYLAILQQQFPEYRFTVKTGTWDNAGELARNSYYDILVAYPDLVGQLGVEGHLLALDSLIKKQKFSIDGMLPAVINQLREAGDGELYGLSPKFDSKAIFFNKDLFQRYHIDYPKEDMTWVDLLHIASRFTEGSDGNRAITGFYSSMYDDEHLYILVNDIAASLDLQYFNKQTMKMELDSKEWHDVFNLAYQAYQTGAVNQVERSSDPLAYSLSKFNAGEAAMTLTGVEQINEMKQLVQWQKADPFSWGIVPAPINPAKPEEAGYLRAGSAWAVHRESTQTDTAWEIVQYINGEAMAKIIAQSATLFPTRVEYLQEMDDINLSHFYKGKSTQNQFIDYIGTAFSDSINLQLRKLIQNKTTIDEALIELQKLGQQMLDQ